MKKTKICAAWRRKACPFDDRTCKFAHGPSDLQKGKPALCELYRAGKRGRKEVFALEEYKNFIVMGCMYTYVEREIEKERYVERAQDRKWLERNEP